MEKIKRIEIITEYDLKFDGNFCLYGCEKLGFDERSGNPQCELFELDGVYLEKTEPSKCKTCKQATGKRYERLRLCIEKYGR